MATKLVTFDAGNGPRPGVLLDGGRVLDLAAAASGAPGAKWLGLLAVVLASINIFGGFAVTERMLAMYKRKERR